jgi:uncharacterized protein involved in response to NO
MTFPVCRHRKRRRVGPEPTGLAWLAAEPFRLFFGSGAAWSVVGVALWPLFYAQKLPYVPNLVHARIMIEVFGGAFVVGFLGTAGPRLATAPRLTRAELVWMFALHLACGGCHLAQRIAWGDGCFILLLASLLLSLVIRLFRFGRETPPPQLLLALTGLGCGIAGAAWSHPETVDAARFRLGGLLLHQGLLLLPALGIGSFLFPRLLGQGFGEATTVARKRLQGIRAAAASVLIVASFFLEAGGAFAWGTGLRAAVAAAYLLAEVRWERIRTGSLTSGLFWALGSGGLGLVLAPFHEGARVSVAHLLYVGGFGLLMLVIGSRVLFGHGGNPEGFFAPSRTARVLVFLGVLAAATRATPAWAPSTTVSHHIYAAWTWGALALLWLGWHRKRFAGRAPDEEGVPAEAPGGTT